MRTLTMYVILALLRVGQAIFVVIALMALVALITGQ